MIIPNSIADITTEKNNDNFVQKIMTEAVDYDRVIMQIKQSLTIEQSKRFDEGLVFYKTSSTYSTFLRNILLLYISVIISSLKKTITDDKERQAAVVMYENAHKTLNAFFDTLFAATENIISSENNIDVQDISCILLGYATETLRRVHNSRNIKGQ